MIETECSEILLHFRQKQVSSSFHIMSEVNVNVSVAHCRGLVLVSMLRCQFYGSFHQFSPSFPYSFHVVVPWYPWANPPSQPSQAGLGALS